ncbi:hypothetical protein FB45DRAFT_1004909 [Roridomyces roridus]|uniref:RING-type domain-containing protein n=1 Tax=Roridomyces roridus TaxID=1738132 RepID=A0AAD7BMA5_9AGAR|nr:hypothetical protein FB45DRAFT_1004909 [Roridomyces roridus]
MSNCHCSVCLSDFPIERFRRLACGHCFCGTCTTELQRMTPRAACPQCRASIAEGDVQPIYLTIVAARPLESVVADGLRRMDHDSKLVSVKIAERKLRQVAEQPHVRREEVGELLSAIEDFSKRIAPIFKRAKSQIAEIATLKRELEKLAELKAEAEQATTLRGEVAILRAEMQELKKELHNANSERELAIGLADKGTKQVLELRKQLQKTQTESQAEIRRLKGFLERNSQDRSAQKQKISGLEQENHRLAQQMEDLLAERPRVQNSSCSDDFESDLEIEEEVFPSPPQSTESIAFPFEGMPRPGFGSDWQLARDLTTDTPVSSEEHLPLPATQQPLDCPTCELRYGSNTGRPYVPTTSPLLDTSPEHILSICNNDSEQLGGDEVDVVIVDRSWSEDFESESNSDAAETASSRHNGTATGAAAVASDDRPEGVWTLPPLAFTRRKLWPRIAQFYMPRFADEADESLYQREVWGQSKRLSLWSSVFFIASCILAIVTIQSRWSLLTRYSTLEWPHFFPFPSCSFLCISAWSWPLYDILYAYLCGFYERNPYKDRPFSCGSKDFLSTFYYTAALQAVAMFGTSLKRLPATIGAVIFLIFSCVTILPMNHACLRNVINFVIFQCVLLYMHSQKENSSRKLFWLRTQLKAQVQQTRKAQMNERQAADSKRRLTSYVFHEVRVPLNTALLAVQNMASRPIAKDHEVEFNALEGSLSMMSKVLNDVLDFNRMDSGQLETLSRPYAFHKVLLSLFIPLRLAADARKLEFVVDLDPRIDEVATRAAYQSMHPTSEMTPGLVVGDETRLRK